MLKRLWTGFICLVVRGFVSLRYRIKVTGLEKLTPENLPKKGGILFLPNHPAEIDPVIMSFILWPKYQVHPIVVEGWYYSKSFHYPMKLVEAVPLPDFNGAVNKWKQKKITKAFAFIAEQLKKGSNFLIYPSGRLKRGPEEIIGGASFVHTLLQDCPEANVVLVRTTGLWGSRFSRALTGQSPDFAKILLEGFKIILKNLIFFTPRREITVEIQPAPADLPRTAPRLELNQYLERWYNSKGPDSVKLVTDCFWKESLPKVEDQKKPEQDDEKWTISPEKEQQIRAKISQLSRRPQVERSQNLNRDLGLDSLDIAQLQTFIEQKYEIEDLSLDQLETVEAILKAVAKNEGQKKVEEPVFQKTFPEEARPPVVKPAGKTLQEAFLRSSDRMDKFSACGDQTMGVVTYRRLKMIVLIMSHKVRQMEGEYIGILLPSSIMAYALVLATLLAKKVPVMLNFTLGERALEHCKKVVDLKTVLSSRRFLDKLPGADLDNLDELIHLLEDVRETVSLWDKFRGIFGLFKNTDQILKDFDLTKCSEDDTAVLLFTSGTESLPKGVPLSHKNILSDLKAAMECFEFISSDLLYGILPPFHSFGFAVTGMMPLMIGLKVYYAPDPTHSTRMLRDIEHWKVTLFISAPTFIKGVFNLATDDQLKSLRYVVGGAEKVPQELFAFMEKRGGEMLEGYGITECSPVVTLTRPKKPRKGVGQPLPGVDLCIVSPETREVMLPGQEGEICIHGTNVFKGYIGTDKKPFIELDGRRWYLSGDIGRLETDGTLILSGRLKRFVKIGGEMVSLGGLEEELLKIAGEKNWLPAVKDDAPPLAVAVLEKNTDKPLIVLFSTFDMNKDVINQILRDRGYSALVKIADVRKVPLIPITGAGKVHYHALDEML
jgi:long-chain-fatty-acid--[acyl-carrier-protein] ligase